MRARAMVTANGAQDTRGRGWLYATTLHLNDWCSLDSRNISILSTAQDPGRQEPGDHYDLP